MELTGVNNVETFDENEIILETEMGYLTVSGENLHISLLNLEDKKVALSGSINGINYKPLNVDLKTKSKSILDRILK